MQGRSTIHILPADYSPSPAARIARVVCTQILRLWAPPPGSRGSALKPGFEPGKDIEDKVSAAIVTEIGKIARPKNVWMVAEMPKTRSGKIMRRVIAAVSNFAGVGDVTTLANPELVDSIRHHVQAAKASSGDVPRELAEAESEELRKFGGE